MLFTPLWVRSQILKVLSREEDMRVRFPFWGNTRFLTTPSCPWRSNTATPGHPRNNKHNVLWRRMVNKIDLPVKTFHILITPLSKPVASSRVLFLCPFFAFFTEEAAGVLGGLGPKARPHTGCPQLKLLSHLSMSSFRLSLWKQQQRICVLFVICLVLCVWSYRSHFWSIITLLL